MLNHTHLTAHTITQTSPPKNGAPTIFSTMYCTTYWPPCYHSFGHMHFFHTDISTKRYGAHTLHSTIPTYQYTYLQKLLPCKNCSPAKTSPLTQHYYRTGMAFSSVDVVGRGAPSRGQNERRRRRWVRSAFHPPNSLNTTSFGLGGGPFLCPRTHPRRTRSTIHAHIPPLLLSIERPPPTPPQPPIPHQ